MPGYYTLGIGCGSEAGGGAVSCLLRMQAGTVSGTSEVEYVVLSEAVEEILFLRQVQDFMEPSMGIGAIHVFEDNEGAIRLEVNKHASRSTKHIDLKHNLMRDVCDAGKVRVVYVRTEGRHADLFTKPRVIQKLQKHVKTVFNVVCYESNVGVHCERS